MPDSTKIEILRVKFNSTSSLLNIWRHLDPDRDNNVFVGKIAIKNIK